MGLQAPHMTVSQDHSTLQAPGAHVPLLQHPVFPPLVFCCVVQAGSCVPPPQPPKLAVTELCDITLGPVFLLAGLRYQLLLSLTSNCQGLQDLVLLFTFSSPPTL